MNLLRYRNARCHRPVILGLLALIAVTCSPASQAAEPVGAWIDPQGIQGSLIIGGGGKLPAEIIDQFIKLAGGEQAHLVIIPTASIRADQEDTAPLLESWQQHKPASLTLLHTRSRDEANKAEFIKPLTKATGVWFLGGAQSRLSAAYLDTAVEKELTALLKRGGVVGGSSAGAAIQSHLMIARGSEVAELQEGFDLLPGTIIDQHFLARKRQPRLLGAVTKHPLKVGLGIDEGTALLVQGRLIKVLGRSSVTVCLAASKTKPALQRQVAGGQRLDLTALRRAARDRQDPVFPPKTLPPARVAAGSLVIVGGGGLPMPIRKRFIELAGGPDALIIVLPTAQTDPLPEQVGQKYFEEAGARNVQVLRARQRPDVESADAAKLLKQAGGIWFGGGRQWRFVDAYENTSALPLIHAVLERGGVIGGSSAGASIQAQYLVRGSPLTNRDMMAAGYERGFGFLPGVAIDQHFAQRKRFVDMTAVMKAHPQLLGIGIDESTALVVQGSQGEVWGKGQVHLYDWRQPPMAGKPDHGSYPAKTRYNLVSRKVTFLPKISPPDPADSDDKKPQD